MSERPGAGAAPADRVQLSGALRDLCEEANQAHLATVLPDGSAHSVPVWIGIEGERVAFVTDPGSRKARNIARDPRVAISVTDREQPFTMAMIRGRVVDRIEGDGAWEIIDRISAVYTGGPYARGEQRVVFLVEPEHLTTTDY
jgi:PPOX class probable F420-dependent enzyme